jgi:hypothetical protein
MPKMGQTKTRKNTDHFKTSTVELAQKTFMLR